MSGTERRAVGVFGGELGPRLAAALEAAFPVAFEGRSADSLRGLDGVIDLGDGSAARACAAGGLRSLEFTTCEERLTHRPASYRVASEDAPDPRLAGALLRDRHAAARTAPPAPVGATVLAAGADGSPLWWQSGPLAGAAMSPAELGEAEALRDRLGEDRSLALLPVVHFLRRICAGLAWEPPPPRAAFVFDDPNLRRPSYGYVDLPALAGHAREHGYHAVLATVPLDARRAHPNALAALTASGGAISLTVHGNDHDGGELGRLSTESSATALAAQALRRVARFESRTGMTIERVMVPPHEACSEATVAALLRCGFEAISMTLPYPWLGVPPAEWLARPDTADALVGWRPLERTAGLPTILRHPIALRSEAEMRLRAYLDQPLVLYGHHDDLAAGLDVLATVQAEVEAIAPGTAWGSLATISRSSYETRVEGSTLAVRPLANRLRVELPEAVESIRVEVPAAGLCPAARLIVGDRAAEFGETVPVGPGAAVEVSLGRVPVEVAEVERPRRRPLARFRRLAGEGRDRLAPLLPR